MPYAELDDIRLYYERAGDPAGRPLLLIGGTGGDLREEPNLLVSPLASAGFDLLAYDQRGLGRSTSPEGPWTMRDYGRDALGLVEAVGWSRSSVLGISFGGMVAQELALLAPDRVERLVLCCTSSGGAGGASYPLHELEDLPVDERARRALELSDVRWDEAWQAAHPDVVELYRQRGERARADPVAAAGARRQLETRAGHDTFDRLSGLVVPVLVCAGRYDGIAPLANAEALAAQIPAARLEAFDGGHLFLLQDPRSWTVISSFLAGGN